MAFLHPKLNMACHYIQMAQAEDIWLKSSIGRKEGVSLSRKKSLRPNVIEVFKKDNQRMYSEGDLTIPLPLIPVD